MPRRTKPRITVELEAPFKIEKKIPIPGACTAGSKCPFARMAVGDSFEFPKALLGPITSASWGYGRKVGARFAIRKVSETHQRCWRVK